MIEGLRSVLYTVESSHVLVRWGVDSLQQELLRLHATDIRPQTQPAGQDIATTPRTATC
jgi:hypothetical protein